MMTQPAPNSELVLNREQVRRVDQIAMEHFCVPGVVLMENAARGCVRALVEQGCTGPVVICCGPGNNGGDGFAMARMLDNLGIKTKLFLARPENTYVGDARINLDIALRMGLEITQISQAGISCVELSYLAGEEVQWIVDALLGTGAEGAPRSPMDETILSINQSKANVLALDLPSGMDCNTGECAESTVNADLTCTFVGRKCGFEIEPSPSVLGEVKVIDIGAPRRAIEMALA